MSGDKSETSFGREIAAGMGEGFSGDPELKKLVSLKDKGAFLLENFRRYLGSEKDLEKSFSSFAKTSQQLPA